jgi:hypothetical protein
VGVAGLVGGLAAQAMVPYFISIGWLNPGDPFRKISFLIALGMILGASIIDLALIGWGIAQRARNAIVETDAAPLEPWQKTQVSRLVLWVIVWGLGILGVGTLMLGQPAEYIIIALLLVFVFSLVNGIAAGLTDWSPVSSSFVVTIVLMASLGLKDPLVGLMAGTALLVAINTGSDMQQDRSTGARLGTNRTVQFRYQVAGIVMGAITAVGFAKLFMSAYPILLQDQTLMSGAQQPTEWTSAMTYKFVGALRSLTDDKPYQRTAIWIGVAIGLVTQLLRQRIKANQRYQQWIAGSRAGFATDFALDAAILPSPYASSFGGFVNLLTSAWFAAGGVFASVVDTFVKRQENGNGKSALPSDMSSTSLVGGGLIAGDALAALALGLAGLAATLFA